MSKEAELKQAKKDREIAMAAFDKEIEGIKAEIEAEKKPELDYDKPILCDNGSSLLLLVSNCSAGSYEIRGYDWLRLSDSQFNSCRLWNTKEEAVKAYGCYRCFNMDFDDLKAMQEDVTEFSCEDSEGDKATFRITGQNIYLDTKGTDGNEVSVALVGAGDKLCQMEATLKRRQK